MRETIRKKIIITVIAILAATVYFVINVNRQNIFQSEVQLLLLPKDAKTGKNIEQVIANAEKIPSTLAFHDKLIKTNPNLSANEEFADLPDYKRKKAWNSEIEISKINNSNIISVKAFADIQPDSEDLSNAVSRDLITEMSLYYNIRTELEMRKIDGPISNEISRGLNVSSIIISLLVGVILWIILNFTIKTSEKLTDKIGRNTFPIKDNLSFSFPTEIKKSEKENRENEKEEFLIEKEEDATVISQEKKASAPENLPIVNEFSLNSSIKVDKKESEQAEAFEPKTHEATEEEIKARLNKLLGFKL